MVTLSTTWVQGRHVPLVQKVPIEQALPQAPQLFWSVRSDASQPLATLPSQSLKPLLQVIPHVPAAQTPFAFAWAAQAFAHMPQLAGSNCVLVQTPPQLVSPCWHESPHLPIEQTLPIGQALPHAPQFALSVWVLA